MEPLAFVLGAAIAAAGFGGGRWAERNRGLRSQELGKVAALALAQDGLGGRVATLEDALEDAMRQALERRQWIEQRVEDLEETSRNQVVVLQAAADRFATIEARQSQGDQASEELTERLAIFEQRAQQQQQVWQQLDQQLQQMQAFIVRTADQAAQQRQALQVVAPGPVVGGPAVVPGAELNTMLQELASSREEFTRRQLQRQGETL